ncbi:COM1 regulatory protein [Apiospora phragmitis]|uniref:COM1 regulatory protein n=1 Tax=Apiospora phragmitis TaxID=2905665 RepID=A0ABR1V0X6_9PEZI
MPALAIPDTGLQLESPTNTPNSLPMQAFGLVLNDDVIEDMIRCVQNGQNLELCLGNKPTLRYGNQEQDIKPTPNSCDYDLFLTNPSESASKAQKLPNPAMSIFKQFSPIKPVQSTIRVEKVTKGGKGSKASKMLPSGKNAMSSVYSSTSTTRSLPTSPAPNGVMSPSLNPAFTASQQKLEKNKEQRSVIVHELAVRDQTPEHLKGKWGGSESEFKDVLGRVADLINGKWSIKKQFWKELDVWSYDYDSQDERQAAIDNAIKQYDKQRYSSTAPEWERLLKKADRGKGIVLSKLQDRLAKGNITPVPKAPKTEEAGKNSSDEVSDRETQAKRLLSNNPKKPAPPKKSAPTTKAKPTDKSGTKKVLSAEFVQDSSSSEDEVPLSASIKSKPAEKTAVDRTISKLAEKIVEKPKESPAPAPKPKAKPVVRAPKAAPAKTSAGTPKAAPKRSREEEDSSSSSGQPLAKRMSKTKEAPKPLSNAASLKHRPSDASQNSRVTASSNVSYKSKNTSPAKSSPLASSPPTNASDFDDDSHSQNQSQRPAARTNGVSNGTATPTKKPRVSPSVLKKAQEFEIYYKRYETLHHELISVRDPPQEDLDKLLKMRKRLADLKDSISREVSSDV